MVSGQWSSDFLTFLPTYTAPRRHYHTDDVADSVAYVATRPPHVTVADVYLLPTNQAHAFEGGIYREKP